MLSYEENEPFYGYYVETDLDCLDQPIDFSKKYSDQDSYENCRQAKSVNKTAEFPASSVQPGIGNTSNDELKVYCIEGTPLTISSASSFCDLREVGTNILQKPTMKRSYPSVDDENSSESFEIKKELECSEQSTLDLPSQEKEFNKEVKFVSFRSGDDISKASSPLMFSRSSSVSSLNSLEQISIVDDRSSVSAFSALTSGIISPSDLPDSPGDLMSPGRAVSPITTDKCNSSKISSKAGSDVESENLYELKTDDENLEDQKNVSDSFEKNNEYEAAKYKENPGENDNNLEQQPDELALSGDSAADLDEVFLDPVYENNCNFKKKMYNDERHNSVNKSDDESDEHDLLLQQCIQKGMPQSTTKAVEKNTKIIDKCERSCYAPIKTENYDERLDSVNKSNDDSSEDDDLLLQKCIQMGMPQSPTKSVEPNLPARKSYSTINKSQNVDSAKSDESDGDDELLLKQCIQQGMPQNTTKAKETSAKLTTYSSHLFSESQQSKHHNGRTNSACKSDDESDGEGDLLLQQCIQMGMPQISTKTKETSIKLNTGFKQMYSHTHKIENFPKSKLNSHVEENERHLQQHIQSEMKREFCNGKTNNSRKFSQQNYLVQSKYYPEKNLRDNCPDGNSDGNDDDDDDGGNSLTKCTITRKPNPKANCSMQKRLSNSPARNIAQKLQIHNQQYIPEIENDRTKKRSPLLPPNQNYAPIHLHTAWLTNNSFIDVDSMRIYRTEDTPILSPSASVSDLSSLSFNDEKSCHEGFLNNSRNSDCSSDSDDDELLLQCIRSGMPEPKTAP